MSALRNFSRQASADSDAAVSRLLDSGGLPKRAEQLLRDVQTAAAKLVARPSAGHRRPDLLPEVVRFWSLPRHRLLLVYTDTTDPPRFLAGVAYVTGSATALGRFGRPGRTGRRLAADGEGGGATQPPAKLPGAEGRRAA